MNYSPLHIYLQPVDDFGVEVGEAENTKNDALVHAQVGEHIRNPRVESEADEPKEIKGTWIVQEREWSEYVNGLIMRQLTIYIRCI